MGSKVEPRKNVLVVDVGGTHVKLNVTGNDERRAFSSGNKLKAQKAVESIMETAGDWKYDAVSIGVPAPVINGRILHEPHNLGAGWVGFIYRASDDSQAKALGW